MSRRDAWCGPEAVTAVARAHRSRRRRLAMMVASGLSRAHHRLVIQAVARASSAQSGEELTAAIEASAARLTGADRATCVFVDRRRQRLWSEPRPDRPAIDTPLAGVAGFAARTGTPLFVEHAADDLRYRPAIDDPDGDPEDRLAAVPIPDGEGGVLAVLVAARSARAPRFATNERRLLAAFATRISPAVDAVLGEEAPLPARPAKATTEIIPRRWMRVEDPLAEMMRVFLPAIVLGLLTALAWPR